jgi:hypothetical protein
MAITKFRFCCDHPSQTRPGRQPKLSEIRGWPANGASAGREPGLLKRHMFLSANPVPTPDQVRGRLSPERAARPPSEDRPLRQIRKIVSRGPDAAAVAMTRALGNTVGNPEAAINVKRVELSN